MVVDNARDFVEEPGRDEIHQWRNERLKKLSVCKSHILFHFTVFNLEILHSFVSNINIMVLLQMLLAGLSVYIFQLLNVSVDINVSLFVSPIVFPLAFCINTDFQRREKVLEDLASFKSAAMVWYFCMRDWKESADLDDGWLRAVQSKAKSVLFHLQEYLLTPQSDRRKIILSALYEDFSDINQLIEKVRVSKLQANTAIISRSIHLLRMMCLAFEKLRVVREYRSPRSIRSFNKVLIMFLPIILAPYFVHVGIQSKSTWQPYCIAVLIAFVFSALQGAQDKLDDPFDGMSEDDINTETMDELNDSLQRITTRTFAIGRFRISMDLPKPGSSRRGRSCKAPVTKPKSATGKSLLKGRTSVSMRNRINTFTNTELASKVGDAIPSKEKVLRTCSTPHYLRPGKNELTKSLTVPSGKEGFNASGVNENKDGGSTKISSALVSVVDATVSAESKDDNSGKCDNFKEESTGETEAKDRSIARSRIKSDTSSKNIHRVSFIDEISQNKQTNEDLTHESIGLLHSNADFFENLAVSDSALSTISQSEDSEIDLDISEDDEDRQLLLSEWQKVDAVLRSEIFEKDEMF